MAADQQSEMHTDEVPTDAVLIEAASAEPRLTREDLDAAAAVLRSGWLTMGPRTAELEAHCAGLLGVDTAVAVGSAAAALHLALDGLGIGPGDEVVVPATAAFGAEGAVRAARATPVLAATGVADAITPRTRAVIAVHLRGQAAPVESLKALCADRGIALLEYLPHGLGLTIGARPAGTFGVAGCFGLLPGGAQAGEAAGLLIGTDELATHARSRRSHAMTSGTWARHTGNADAYDVEAVGFNHRPDELRSAIVLSRLQRETGAAGPRAAERSAPEGAAKGATPYVIPLTDVIVPEDDVEATLAVLAEGWHGAGPRVEATLAVLAEGWHGAGPRVEAFEHAFADHNDVRHAVAVTSGTAALHLALLAAGVGPGDEVLVPGFTFVATAAAVRYCGAEPVLVDVVSAADGLIDVEDAAARITPRTRAMVAVHMFGYAAAVPALRALCDEHGIVLIEDVAQAVGARLPGGAAAGTGGALGCFSLFSKKQLCTGEGGMVVTDDDALAARLRELRDPRTPDGPGLPQALAEPHAALGLNRLPRLAADIAIRRAGVRAYRERLAGAPGVELTFDDAAVASGSHFAFPILAADGAARDALKASLRAGGIQTTNYPSLTRLSAYAGTRSLPRAEAVADRHLCLPLSSHTTEQQVALVSAAVLAAS